MSYVIGDIDIELDIAALLYELECSDANKTDVERIAKLIRAANGYQKALESIAANSCCDTCQEAALVARAVIAKAESKTSGEKGQPATALSASNAFFTSRQTPQAEAQP